MKRILFIMPSLVGGGAERTLLNVLTSLDRTKFQPVLFLQKKLGTFLDRVPSDVEIHYGSEPPGRTLFQLHRFLRELWRSSRGVNLVVGYLELTPGYLAIVIGWLRRKPSLAMVHINLDSYLGEVARWHTWASKGLYPKVSGVIFCSKAGRDAFQRVIAIPDSRLHVIHNPIDLDHVAREASQPLPELAKQATAKPFFLGVGRLEAQKGFDLLLRAFALVIASGLDYHLIILGSGPDGPSLLALANELQVSQRVFFLGFTQNPFPFFRAANQFVLSSRFEGMPTVVLEAMTLSVPTVCFDGKSGTRELFCDNYQPGLLVPAENIEKLAEAIQLMEKDLALRQRSVRDGLAVSLHYRMQIAISEWETILA